MREFILYSIVAILTVLGLVAAVNFFGQGRDNQNLTAATADLVTMVQNIQAVYAGQSFLGMNGGNGSLLIINGGMAPSDMVVDLGGGNMALRNQFGDYVDIGDGYDGSGNSFTVSESSVPSSVCAKFATAFSGGGLKSLTVNDSQPLVPGGTGLTALNVTNVTKFCHTVNDNLLTFEFGH